MHYSQLDIGGTGFIGSLRYFEYLKADGGTLACDATSNIMYKENYVEK